MGVLRQWFGPSRQEIWRQLAEAIGARYVEGGTFKSDKVQAEHGQWTVTLDVFVVSTGTSAIPFTRIRAPYVNPDGFRFTIYRRGVFSDVAKWFGMQDIEIGHPAFDRDFILKATDESKLKRLLAGPKLRQLIESQSNVKLTVKDDEGWFGPKFPEGVDELLFTVPGVIKDVERLAGLFDLFAEVLDELCRIGSAYEDDPGVKV